MRLFNRLSLAALLLSAGLTAEAQAGPLADAAAKAEAAIAANDFDAWYAANGALLDAAWDSAGLHFGSLVPTTDDAAGYGNYEPRGSTTYASGEAIHFYVEPRGYGFGDLGNGVFEVAFDIDLRVLDPSGNLLMEQPNFTNFSVQSREKFHELMVNLTATLTGAPAGGYVLEFNFRDHYGDQAAKFTSEITIQ